MVIKNKDIAEILNISPAAVSLARNGKSGVSEQTRKQVYDLLRSMENKNRKEAETDPKGSITLVMHKKSGKIIAETQFFMMATEVIQEEAQRAGYCVTIMQYNETADVNEFIKSLKGLETKGILLLATEMDVKDLDLYRDMEVPIVILDNYYITKRQDCVAIHNVDAMFQIAEYLKKMGHTRIGFLKSKIENNNFSERYKGLQLALDSLGDVLEPKFVYRVGTEVDTVYEDMKGILMQKVELPDVLVAGNDILAIGAMRALKEYGYRVPEDISIVGFDDMPVSRMMDPPLTSIRIEIKQFAICAVERIVQKIERYSFGPTTIRVGCELMIRDSVKNMNEMQQR